VLDYLGDEVLTRLTPAQRTVLLRATLVERFNTSLLEHLAATHDGEAIGRADLERLRALELYREIPGLSDTWFAYHALFRDALRREFERSADAGARDELHRSVAEWFTGAGFTQEGVHHLVAVNDFAGAVTLIGFRLNDAFAREDWRAISSWLHEIPREELEKSPELLLASAWVGYLSGRDARTADVLAALRTPRIRNQVTRAQRAEMAILADWSAHDPDAMVRVAEEAITQIPPQKRYRLGYAHMTLGMVLTSLGRGDEALAGLVAFTDRESGWIDAASIRGYFGRTIVFWQLGRLTPCEQTAADLLQLARSNNLAISAGWGATFLGAIAHERGDFGQASRHLETVFADAERVHFMALRDAFFAQILAYHAQGLYDEAERALARLREHVMATETRHHLDIVDSLNARTALIRGDLVAARRWLDALPSPVLGQTDLKSLEHPILTRAKVLIAVGDRASLAEAEQYLTAFVDEARATHMVLALLEGLAVQALLHETQGDHARATRSLQASLALAAPEGIVQRYAYLGATLAPILRRILDGASPVPHARTVLNALEMVLAAQPALLRTPSRPTRDTAHTPLSEREQQVLRCLSLRLTNNEIGDELYISPITVKNHIAHISEKLGVSGRRAAVQRANELGLLAAGA
jgi:LuxR family maltose regulon positive regulatory protein